LEPVERMSGNEGAGKTAGPGSGYVIIEEIGRGGMGIVYRAHDVKLGRVVALKRPKPELMERQDFAKRFLREARTASRLLHPNITTVFAAFEEDGVPWLVMELVEGGSLRDRLASGRPLPVGEIIAHGEGLADALRAAHEKGIIHSDVNPNNVLLGKDGRARLTDFGLARAREVPGEAPIFGDGAVPGWSAPEAAGTRGYMAPEHLRGRGLDPRSDLYCLGLVLFEMCTGQSAFAGKNTVEWVGAALEGETERLTTLGPHLPPELARIVAKATATEPRRRYQNAAAMAEDLRALRRFRESGVELQIAAAARARKHTSYGVLGAVVAVAAAATGWLLLAGRGRPPALASRPLTSAPGWEAHPAISPNGRLVAYAANESGNSDIWLVEVDRNETTRLTDGPGDEIDPCWYPDGTALACVVRDRSGESIVRVPLSGGRPAVLVTNALYPAVSPDGTRIAYSARDESGYLRIAVAPLAEPTRARILTGPGDGTWDHEDPAWSPDGRRICFADARNLLVIDADGPGGAIRLTTGPGGDREPVWSADGRYIYFSSLLGGPRALWRVPAAGGKPERLTQGTGPEVQPSTSRDGRRLAYATRRLELDIDARDARTGATWRLASSAYDAMPAVAPDGRAAAFVSNRLGTYDLWVQTVGGSGPEGPARRLTELPGTVAAPAYSPDGRWLAFHRTVDGERDIWLMPARGGTVVNLTAHPGTDAHLAFSPDGTRVAFLSERGGGEHLWVAPFAAGRLTGEPRQVTTGEGSEFSPTWSPDGRWLAFVRTSGTDTDVWVVELDTSRPPRRVSHGIRVDWVRWGPEQAAVYASARWGGRFMEVRRVRVADGAAEALDPPLVLGGEGATGTFDLSSDGHLFAIDATTTTGDIWMAEGVPERL